MTHEQMTDWCISCCDGALTDEQRSELRSRIKTCLDMKDDGAETVIDGDDQDAVDSYIADGERRAAGE